MPTSVVRHWFSARQPGFNKGIVAARAYPGHLMVVGE